MPEKTHALTVRLPKETRRMISDFAEELGESESTVVRLALRQYFSQLKGGRVNDGLSKYGNTAKEERKIADDVTEDEP